MNRTLLTCCLLLVNYLALAEDGYRLWLRYENIADPLLLKQYRAAAGSIYFEKTSPTLEAAKKELEAGLNGLLGIRVGESKTNPAVIVRVPQTTVRNDGINYTVLGEEGFTIQYQSRAGKKHIVIAAATDKGALYGVFHFLRLLQSGVDVHSINITSVPKIRHRILNHWDNLNRHVERGYAGLSIWNWHTLPGYIDQRYIDYARANASIGINGVVLTNVNANALVLTQPYLEKVAALADAFRPYGIKVYLTARFSAPVELDKLPTADPLDPIVQQWWNRKAGEIYKIIPDFGGFLVKANSEGQPGPQNYGRTHADGANMLAKAVAPNGGIVMWRAFVYSNESPEDRFKQAFQEFKPLDGAFNEQVLVQVKNGPIDFQPREPFSPLFGAMPKTPLMMELQITQEYLGQSTHLVYLAPMFREVLQSDTWQQGKGSTVAKVIDGSVHNYKITGIAGVANIGNDINWTGHPFGQANWYAFGRLAWDHQLDSRAIANEWIRQSFTQNAATIQAISRIMQMSYETMVQYMTPLGLHHIMGTGHHYGPAPWVSNTGRADWNPVYYHKADSFGIGFNRTTSGSNALAQYAPEVRAVYENPETCPDAFLLWFHHISWKHPMRSGRILWDELCYRYNAGVDSVKAMRKQWAALEGRVDEQRFRAVSMLLNIQVTEAQWWRNACLLYFQQFSKLPFPKDIEQPEGTLEYYQQLKFPYAPGNG